MPTTIPETQAGQVPRGQDKCPLRRTEHCRHGHPGINESGAGCIERAREQGAVILQHLSTLKEEGSTAGRVGHMGPMGIERSE